MSASRFVEANGLRLHYLERGRREQHSCSVPGLTANAHSFDGLSRPGWRTGLRMLAFDARGRGLGDQPAEGYTIADHAVDVLGSARRARPRPRRPRRALVRRAAGAYLAAHRAGAGRARVVLDAPPSSTRVLDQIAPSLARLDRTFASWAEYDAFVRSFPYWDGFSWSSDVQGRTTAATRSSSRTGRCGRAAAGAHPRRHRGRARGRLAGDARGRRLPDSAHPGDGSISARPAPGRSSRPRAHGAPSR